MTSVVETSLSSAERDALGEIAATMIPADAGLGMPGAGDPAILADIVGSLGSDLPLVRKAIAALGTRAFASLDRDGREALVNDYHQSGDAAAAALGRVALGAYYRDDRVLVALGHEARAPFPKGYVVEQGDWSLLDAVRGRAPFWRKDL
jgi:hypothetical protein